MSQTLELSSGEIDFKRRIGHVMVRIIQKLNFFNSLPLWKRY